MIFFTGVGKSGFISKKVSTMLVSIGFKSLFLSPTDALHGDIGIVSEKDILVILTRSGSTEELIQLCPAARRKGCKIIAVTSERDCALASFCDGLVVLPLQRELCPFDLAPVTSSTVQLIFGDTLVTALMMARGLSREDYAVNHPAGRIGKRLTLQVSHAMVPLKDCPVFQESETLLNVLFQIPLVHCGCILVRGIDGTLLGVCTDGDIRRALKAHQQKALCLRLSDLMTRNPKVISHNTSAFSALKEMEQAPMVSVLPVMRDDELVGLVTVHELVKLGL